MSPHMSVNEMVDSFIFIAKGSRVIDRKATVWSRVYWLSEKSARHLVYSMADLKKYFGHRVVKSKWRYERRDPFNDWFMHPRRLTYSTLSDAMKFADMAALGLIEPRLDVEAIIKSGEARAKSLAAPKYTAPPWERAA